MKNKIIQKRDSTQTKARILAKSTKIFAANGFAGSAISEIIKSSKVNQRMVYHYFGDKEGLYRAVFLQQWGELKEWFDRALQKRIEVSATPVDSKNFLAEALGIFFDFMQTHQNFVRLMMWESLEGGWISRSIWADVRGPIYIQIEFLIRQVQEQGLLAKKIDPAHLIISFLGAISFYFAYAPTLTDMLHKDPLDPQTLAERKRQVLYLLEGLYRSST